MIELPSMGLQLSQITVIELSLPRLLILKYDQPSRLITQREIRASLTEIDSRNNILVNYVDPGVLIPEHLREFPRQPLRGHSCFKCFWILKDFIFYH